MIPRWRAVRLLPLCLLQCSMGQARADSVSTADAGLDGRGRFEAALELASRDERQGAEALLSLADTDPAGEYAADALAEAAMLLDERLGQPDRARPLYARLLVRYPDSRPALRARARLDFLDENLRTGPGPLGEYQRILAGFARRPHDESRRLMGALLEQHPDFTLSAQALLWLGTVAERDGLHDEAERRFSEVERRFPGGEVAAQARKGRADALLAAGHPGAARDLYRSLRGPPFASPLAEAAALAGEAACARALRREYLFYGALALLLAYLGATLRVARPLGPARVGPELAYYLPVAGLFTLAAATETRAIAVATTLLAAGGAAITWSSARAAARLAPRRRALGLLALATVLAVLALTYAALHKARLVDFVIETLRAGPDR